MYQHAHLQKALTAAFAVPPSYLGLLAEDHWFVQFQDMDFDFSEEDLEPQDGQLLARGENDEAWFYAWRLANGRLVVAEAAYSGIPAFEGPLVQAEVLPTSADAEQAIDWVRSRSNSDDFRRFDAEAAVESFTSTGSGASRRPPAASRVTNGRQPGFFEWLTGLFGRR